jgi:hypothetical protein
VSITAAKAEALFASVDAEKAARAAKYPTEQDALRGQWEAHYRLRELGWREACYAPCDGRALQLIEVFSTGIFEGYRDDKRRFWIADGGDLWPSTPVLYREKPRGTDSASGSPDK